MLTSRTTEPRRLSAPWSHPTPHESCNFHFQAKAEVRYAGTPLCERCALEVAKEPEPFWR